MLSRILGFVLIVTIAQSMPAQVSINGIQVVNSSGQGTGNTVVTQVSGQVTVRNDFNVDIVVQLWRNTDDDDDLELVAEETIEADGNPVETHSHGQSQGECEIRIFEAGQPDTTKDGTLDVQNPQPV